MKLRLVLPAFVVLFAGAAHADPITVYAAGSLIAPLRALIAASALPSEVKPSFGPSGLLVRRIEAGERPDLLLSADTAGPAHLSDIGRTLVPAVPFARNRMCVAGRAAGGLAADNVLDTMLRPDLRLASSTPAADPGGDYAFAVFARADALRPGARPTLEHKALQLLGGPDSMQPVTGHSPTASIFIADRADLLIYYCSGTAALLSEMPGLVSIPVPSPLEPGPIYSMAVISGNPDALRLALFILSEKGQSILTEAGLLPVLAPGER